MSENEQRCGLCRFMAVSGTEFLCARFPPTTQWFREKRSFQMTFYPVVADDGWCGEFERKEPPA